VEPDSLSLRSDSAARRIFVGPDGLRAGWRLLVFLVLVVVLEIVYFLLLRVIPGAAAARNMARSGTIPAFPALVNEFAQCLIVFAAASVMSRFERRSWSEYGFPWNRALRSEF
jgi:uncharacterized protein